MSTALLATRLFINNLRNLPGPEAERHIIAGGEQFDLYSPPASRQTILLVPGFGLSGEADPRVTRFARAFVSVGVQVAVPLLDGLRAYRFDPQDLETLAGICQHLHKNIGRPLGMVAFSAGASLGLCAAARDELRDVINPLILFSPIADMYDTWQAFHQRNPLPPEGSKAWDDFIWAQCIIAWRNREKLGLSSADTTRLAHALRRYSVGMRSREKKNLYEHFIYPLDILSHPDLLCEETDMRELSPIGRLGNVRARVVLFHQQRDNLVPASHSERLFQELQARGGGREHLFLNTALAHANLNRFPNLRQVWKVLQLMGILFEPAKP